MERFCLACDNDAHWYVIPMDRRAEWNDWLDIDADDERAWQVPAFARAIGGSPTRVTFEQYLID